MQEKQRPSATALPGALQCVVDVLCSVRPTGTSQVSRMDGWIWGPHVTHEWLVDTFQAGNKYLIDSYREYSGETNGGVTFMSGKTLPLLHLVVSHSGSFGA